MLALIVREPLRVDAVLAHVARPSAGGIALFIGAVREQHEGRRVEKLEYTAYESMARAELERIVFGLEESTPGARIAAMHRIGMLQIGDAAIV